MTPDDEGEALARLAARVGADPSLVQGPGGNVSLKRDGVLWVKASGTWLADAQRRTMMIPVALAPLLAALDRRDPACETCTDFVRHDLNAGKLRPSIETTLHAVMPQRVVVHVHCVETIAWAARADAGTAIAQPLDGLPWAFVPYARPGVPLTEAILAALRPEVSVLVLGNHGLVVAADTVAAAEALLRDVVRRLKKPKRPPAARPDPARLAAVASGSAYAPAKSAALHAVATDPDSLGAATAGSLYPDHVIFLGPGVVAVREGETAARAARRAKRPALPLLLVPGAGALVHADATAAMLALAGCLADVACRLGPDDPLRALTTADEAALLGWDAEKYRQALDGKPA